MKQLIHYIKKALINGGIFLLLVIFTYFSIFAKLDFSNARSILKSFNPWFLILAVIAAVFMLILETMSIKRNLMLLGEKISFFSCLKYSFAGNFFSTITPGASGGQPMQIYFMHADGIKTSKGTLALMIDLALYQCAIIVLSLIGFIYFHKRITEILGSFYFIFILGIILNISLFTVTCCAIFSKKAIYAMLNFTRSIVKLVNAKKADSFYAFGVSWIERYKQGAIILKGNKDKLFLNSLFMFLRIFLMHTAPYWVYRGLGLSGESFFFIFALQAVIHISCAALPLPGGVGIGEKIFLICFRSIFSLNVVDTAMILSRSIGLYSIAFISGCFLFTFYFLKKQIDKKKLSPL